MKSDIFDLLLFAAFLMMPVSRTSGGSDNNAQLIQATQDTLDVSTQPQLSEQEGSLESPFLRTEALLYNQCTVVCKKLF